VEPYSLYHAQLEDRLARDYGVSSRVHLTAKPVQGRATDFLVTITNISGGMIGGPVLLVFTSLPPGIALTSVAGYTAAGDPFVVESLAGLAAGRSATALVRFTAPPSHRTVFEVLAGLPQPLERLRPEPLRPQNLAWIGTV
jgi:hypothetical protein